MRRFSPLQNVEADGKPVNAEQARELDEEQYEDHL
jgi:hypothetical protein